VKILIADDHPIVRKGLKGILVKAYPDALIEEVSDGAELLLQIGEYNWDVIISDISMPGMSGVEIVKKIKQRFPQMPVLILSTHPAEQYGYRMFKAGASGYLTKETAPEELVKAVNCVVDGKRFIPPEMEDDLLEDELAMAVHQQLSDIEMLVFKLITQGKSDIEMAAALSLTIAAVNTHRTRILLKMHMQDETDLIKYNIQHQLFRN
jgi:two-component system invasion response regulator UvrY